MSNLFFKTWEKCYTVLKQNHDVLTMRVTFVKRVLFKVGLSWKFNLNWVTLWPAHDFPLSCWRRAFSGAQRQKLVKSWDVRRNGRLYYCAVVRMLTSALKQTIVYSKLDNENQYYRVFRVKLANCKWLFDAENMDRFLIEWYFYYWKGGKFYMVLQKSRKKSRQALKISVKVIPYSI